MLEDTMESMDDQEELEDAAQEEVDKILFEVTSGKIFFFYIFIFILYFFQSRISVKTCVCFFLVEHSKK